MFRRDLSSEMIFLGAKFFVLQVVGVVLFATTSVMIAHLFGPDEVAVYAVAFRYYALPMTGFNMLLVPYWSAYTQAFAIGEFEWIRSSIHRLRGYLWWLLLLLLLMMFFAEDIYTVWIKTEVGLPGALSVALVLYVLISSWCNIHVNLINGVGKLNLQIVFALSSVVLFIPLSYVLSTKIILGGAGIVAAICIVLLPACILWPIQSSKLLRGTASGIWGA
jgi:O-antigen/teichoic acid export membrane protein